MKLYYGSKTYLQTPSFGEGNPNNDYGLGFYMSDNFSMAKLWASQYEDGGYAITYDCNLSGLSILKLDSATEEDVLRWITLLVKHRFSYQQKIRYKDVIDWMINHFDVQISQYDMVIGYRADDSYFNYSIGFVAGEISLQTLLKAMKLGKLGLQYVLISKQSFRRIQFVDATIINYSDDYSTFRRKTLDEYHELLNQEDRFNNTFIGELMKKYGE